jgi:hypothetical protein
VSAAGEALATLPPSVPRFWMARPPVSDAARQSIGNSLCIVALRRTSV